MAQRSGSGHPRAAEEVRFFDGFTRLMLAVMCVILLFIFASGQYMSSNKMSGGGTDDRVNDLASEVTQGEHHPFVELPGDVEIGAFSVANFFAGLIVGYHWVKLFSVKARVPSLQRPGDNSPEADAGVEPAAGAVEGEMHSAKDVKFFDAYTKVMLAVMCAILLFIFASGQYMSANKLPGSGTDDKVNDLATVVTQGEHHPFVELPGDVEVGAFSVANFFAGLIVGYHWIKLFGKRPPGKAQEQA